MASKQYFPTVGQIEFEGLESKNPMAFRYYDPEKVVKGRKMKDWFRFSMAWWHTLCAEGGEVDGKRNALTKVHAVFSRYDGDAYTGTLDNGEQILTLVCYEDDKHAAKTDDTTVYVLLSVLEGHDAYLVNADGTETKIEVQLVGREGKFHIDLRGGAALVHLVPKAEQ